MQTYQKKPSEQTQSQNITLPNLTTTSGAIPNSAMLSMLRIAKGETTDLRQADRADATERMNTLREGILSRMSRTPIRPQAPIPGAEAEADRLSSNVSAASPEGVKRDLGRRMNADFSGVRFHTDEDAAAKADAMGTPAFTSGADVYFGEGGFDPTIAAHELVHTAQQGMVATGVETMSTPVGGVQMASTWASRKHHDKVDKLYQAMTTEGDDGQTDWSRLTPEQQKAWKKKHPIVYRQVKKAIKNDQNGDGKEATKIRNRIAKRQDEMDQAKAFLAGRNQPKTSMLTKDEQGQWHIGVNRDSINPADPSQSLAETNTGIETEATGAQDKLDQASEATDLAVQTPLGAVGSAIGTANDSIGSAALGTSSDVLGGAGAGFNVIQGTYGMVNDSIALAEAIKGKDAVGAVDAGVSLAGNASSVASGITDVASLAGAVSGTAGGVVGGVTGIIGGGANIYSGAREIHEGRKKTNAMKGIEKELGPREQLEDNDLLLRDTAEQARQEGVRQQTEGSGKVITGSLDAAAGALQIAGVAAPVAAVGTSIAGAALSGISAATKVGFKIADHKQKQAMKKDVVEQTLGISEQDIKDFQATSGIKNYHRAKQALMKSMGYTSGQRREAYADQTEKRGEYFAEKAEAGDVNAKKLMKGLGVKADKQTGAYDAGAAAKSMGLRESRAQILAKTDPLGAQIRKAKQNQAQNAAP